MKRTKQNMVKILEAIMENEEGLSTLWGEQGNMEMKRESDGASLALQRAIWVLTDPAYFDEMVRIYQVSEN